MNVNRLAPPWKCWVLTSLLGQRSSQHLPAYPFLFSLQKMALLGSGQNEFLKCKIPWWISFYSGESGEPLVSNSIFSLRKSPTHAVDYLFDHTHCPGCFRIFLEEKMTRARAQTRAMRAENSSISFLVQLLSFFNVFFIVSLSKNLSELLYVCTLANCTSQHWIDWLIDWRGILITDLVHGAAWLIGWSLVRLIEWFTDWLVDWSPFGSIYRTCFSDFFSTARWTGRPRCRNLDHRHPPDVVLSVHNVRLRRVSTSRCGMRCPHCGRHRILWHLQTLPWILVCG